MAIQQPKLQSLNEVPKIPFPVPDFKQSIFDDPETNTIQYRLDDDLREHTKKLVEFYDQYAEKVLISLLAKVGYLVVEVGKDDHGGKARILQAFEAIGINHYRDGDNTMDHLIDEVTKK